MKYTEIQSCYIGPEISPEQFIPEHFFLYLLEGKIEAFDGGKHYTLLPKQACLVRKNHLARYNKQKDSGSFGKVVVIFDEAFLRTFHEKYKPSAPFNGNEAFLPIKQHVVLHDFVESLQPLYRGEGQIAQEAAEQKREELLGLLLQLHPEYASVLFDFGKPGKVNLEAFMQKHYKFNVRTDRLAFLTGRSLSSFKRDFKAVFNETPSRWLVNRRLQEARFLLEQKQQKPSDFYLDLGFEDLSHFSFAFKKKFGLPPTAMPLDKYSI
ncbi:AraC family transcriptional regulator [Marinilongibacter aquaticus]|uniref:helix-turn-helix domain-containing protein n=1 Tax=Marinilongibacter aquaticus TaxID=2975157 RepID=UPI0021BD619B|nr:AraC family transcriptional regulator [Marinilongibacter aquaticus]UBM59887.1 AraC family transcriptional regulator [Marinilongibacter aquaticus]